MRALCRLAEVEAECKKNGAAVETLCGQLILGLSHAPGSGAQHRFYFKNPPDCIAQSLA